MFKEVFAKRLIKHLLHARVNVSSGLVRFKETLHAQLKGKRILVSSFNEVEALLKIDRQCL